jgi:hypothetical protein
MTQERPKKNPNPQGKGLVPILNELQALSTEVLEEKSPLDFFRDYCLSSLVLAADFKFRPVPNKDYYLYSTARNWNLSMVAPEEWHGKMPGLYIAHCLLRTDMTWQVEFTQLETHCEENQKLENFVAGFVESVGAKDDVSDSLPFYAAQLPYHHRVLATALAASLQHTMPRNEKLTQLLKSSVSARRLLKPAEQAPKD